MDKDEIVKDLTRRITSEDLKQGQWLVEREISERYGISRTPVREILSSLAGTGLIEQLPGKGFRVRQLKFEDIIDIFNAREATETMLTRLACKLSNPAFLAELAQFKNALLGVDVLQDIHKAMVLGRNIHDCIADGANTPILAEFYYKLKDLHAFTASLTRKMPHIEEKSQSYHVKIIDALEARDVALSESLMRDHLRLTCRLSVEGYISQRTGFDSCEEDSASGA